MLLLVIMGERVEVMGVRLPAALAATLGPILAVETPLQGSAFQVVIVTTPRGRFVVKRGMTPETRAELAAESRVLQALRGERPFVAAPVGVVPDDETETFAFSYIPGETMLAALQRADEAAKHALLARFGTALRRIHGWTPPLPRPDEWLRTLIAREQARMAARPPGAVIRGTHTRFEGQDARRVAGDLWAWQAGVATELAFGHGDYCLPNVLVRQGAVVGVVDWSRGGYADRRFDLATGLFNLRYNLGDAAYLTTFLGAYGYMEPVETLHMFEALHALTCFWPTAPITSGRGEG
jgi:aminoglycoside phosphotransferase